MNVYKHIVEEVENYINEKLEAIKNIKSILGDNALQLNPNINGLEEAYQDILNKINDLKLTDMYLAE